MYNIRELDVYINVLCIGAVMGLLCYDNLYIHVDRYVSIIILLLKKNVFYVQE